jgi:hypothetical protein
MWAGYIALVNQQLVANGKKTIGFLNPTIYAQNVTSAYAADFHDITSGTSGSYSAVTGYDLVTGWGSPNTGLLAALTGSSTPPPTNDFSISATSPTIAAGSSGTSTISTSITSGSAETVSLSASGLPAGVTLTFNPTSVTSGSGSTATITVASTVAAGVYGITVTGTAASGSHTATISLHVTSTAGGNFTVAVSPTSGSLPRGYYGIATVTTAVSGGFSAPITFSASGMGAGTTIVFSPASIKAPGSGTINMYVEEANNAALGTFPIVVTATGGGKSHTATLTLTVTR